MSVAKDCARTPKTRSDSSVKSSAVGAVVVVAAVAAARGAKRRVGSAETKSIESSAKPPSAAGRPTRPAKSADAAKPRVECDGAVSGAATEKSSLRIYAKQRLQISPTRPIAIVAPGTAYALRVPVTVHQGAVSLASAFSWSDTSRPNSTNVETVAVDVLRDGKSVTKGERIIYEETFSVTTPTPYVAARSFVFRDRAERGRHVYTLLFTNSTLSTVSLVLRDINFTVTC